MRPQVQKYLAKFQGYVQQYGPETVRKVLRDGQAGKLRLTIMKNRKDRYQMMQILGLLPHPFGEE